MAELGVTKIAILYLTTELQNIALDVICCELGTYKSLSLHLMLWVYDNIEH